MSNQLVWQDRYNIGVDVIDKEHKKLFSILNRLLRNGEHETKGQWACEEGIKYFKDHAMKHFSEEEAYMASISYREFETHKRLHDNFRRKILPELEKELEHSSYSAEAINHFLGVCAGWLIGHTLTEDRAITGEASSKWVDLMSEEEQAAMKQVVLNLLEDMFQLKARVISECYGGERFGKGIYYRLVYSNDKGEKWETVLVFEEKLLANTVGKMMGAESEDVDVLLMNVVRYTARQFVERIKEHFAALEEFRMKEENLLTYEQFAKVYDMHNPQFSYLFNTGQGYFAFCVVAPHLVENDDTIAIKPENAMEEIRKYLKKSSKPDKKKKILVVDDSETMCLFLKKLLGIDYEISLANSGFAAIRSLTLNRPDLILLDYEMPVCDGHQVLEMIRSEKELADIPVIFLTGRVDRESVTKVIALKPNGYLSKGLQPKEIKKGIDDYFEQYT